MENRIKEMIERKKAYRGDGNGDSITPLGMVESSKMSGEK